MDQRGQECGKVDEAVVPALQGQRGAAAPIRPVVQPGERATETGAAEADPELDADDAAGEVNQDRGQSCPSFQVRGLPAGGGG